MLKLGLTVTVACMAALGSGALAAGLSTAAVADVENWSRFRGPNGTGVSSATNLPVEFGPESHVKWKAAVPPGHSSPVFTDSHIFLSAHSPEKDAYKLFVLALDRKSGKQLWQHEIPRLQKGRRENVNGPASPSPVTDGANVYYFFQDFGLISYTADGKERWRMPLGPFNMFYGFGASPILEDGTLLLAVDQDTDPYLLARRCEDRQAALAGRAPARHLRLLDADDLAAEDRARADPHSGIVPAHRLLDRRRHASCGGCAAWRAK